ncbi:MAG TPA: hypothetical protein VF772_11275 [Terriglobales bacterium]
MPATGYNSPLRMNLIARLAVFSLAFLLTSSTWAASAWDAPSAEMAKQIAAVTGPGTISLSIKNRSSISTDEIPAIRKALERELRTAGVTVRAQSSNAEVRLTLSQNAKGWLWVAEVQEGAELRVAMLQLPATVSGTSAATTPRLVLQDKLLLRQLEPILDIVNITIASQPSLVVLEPEHIRWYVADGIEWKLKQSFEVAHTNPFPRDVRGRIVTGGDHPFSAYLPGVVCNATKTEEAGVAVACVDSDDPWPLGTQKAFYNSQRNFFTGVFAPGVGAKLPQLYSATEVEHNGATALLLVDLGGQAHLFENGTYRNVIGARDWGSDIAVVRSECGAGSEILASAAGWPVADSLRAYEISGHELTPVSAALSFEGSITALWQWNDGTSATVVVRNPQDAQYEAHRVTIGCSR